MILSLSEDFMFLMNNAKNMYLYVFDYICLEICIILVMVNGKWVKDTIYCKNFFYFNSLENWFC